MKGGTAIMKQALDRSHDFLTIWEDGLEFDSASASPASSAQPICRIKSKNPSLSKKKGEVMRLSQPHSFWCQPVFSRHRRCFWVNKQDWFQTESSKGSCFFCCACFAMFVCLLACLFVCLLACLLVCLSVCLSVCLFVCLFALLVFACFICFACFVPLFFCLLPCLSNLGRAVLEPVGASSPSARLGLRKKCNGMFPDSHANSPMNMHSDPMLDQARGAAPGRRESQLFDPGPNLVDLFPVFSSLFGKLSGRGAKRRNL